MDNKTIEQIELLLKAEQSPESIAKLLKLKTAEVKQYLKDKLDKENRLTGKEGELLSRLELRRNKTKKKPAVPQNEFVKDQLDRMRLLRKMGYSTYTIATTFGLPHRMVFPYVKDIEPDKVIRQPSFHLTDEDIKQVKFMCEKGFTEDQIARFLGVTEVAVINAKKKLGLE